MENFLKVGTKGSRRRGWLANIIVLTRILEIFLMGIYGTKGIGMIGLDFMGLMELGFYGIKGKYPFLFNL